MLQTQHVRFVTYQGLKLDRDGIKTFLPHRHSALLIDGVTRFSEQDKSLSATRWLTVWNDEFDGHFVNNPVLRLTTAEEMAFLACGCLAWCLFPELPGLPMAVATNSRMNLPIKPECTIYINVVLKRKIKNFFLFSGTITDETGVIKVTFNELKGAIF